MAGSNSSKVILCKQETKLYTHVSARKWVRKSNNSRGAGVRNVGNFQAPCELAEACGSCGWSGRVRLANLHPISHLSSIFDTRLFCAFRKVNFRHKLQVDKFITVLIINAAWYLCAQKLVNIQDKYVL